MEEQQVRGVQDREDTVRNQREGIKEIETMKKGEKTGTTRSANSRMG